MYLDILRLVRKYFFYVAKMLVTHIVQRREAKTHRRTYKALPSSKSVVVLGGSFTGIYLTHRLAESLPSGYKVIVVERNSHFNYTFNFPRYSVIEGHEHQAFVPFDGFMKEAPEGIYERVVDEVKGMREGEVELASGKIIPFEFLAVATGALQSPPAKLLASKKGDACRELSVLQQGIKESKNIAIVGGGPVGVQIAGDIKTFQPEKRVVLIHSRMQLLPNFGMKLHNYVVARLKALGVELILGERPVLGKETNWESKTLEFKDGRKVKFDLVIPCTGQTPNSSILDRFAPTCISPQNHRILVKPTLQLKDLKETDTFKNVYALGDVAETGAPKMARAGMMQAELVRGNIVAQINGKPLKDYIPVLGMEGILKLSLGKDENVTYVPDEDDTGYLFPGKSTNIDLEVAKIWQIFGADLCTAASLD